MRIGSINEMSENKLSALSEPRCALLLADSLFSHQPRQGNELPQKLGKLLKQMYAASSTLGYKNSFHNRFLQLIYNFFPLFNFRSSYNQVLGAYDYAVVGIN